MKILKAGLAYFLIVFGMGFVLGPIRVLAVAPYLGERTAELIEAPIMLTVILTGARWVIRRFELGPAAANRLGMGLIGLGLVLALEFSLVLWLRGVSLGEYVGNRDPVSMTVYYALLTVFAIAPLFVSRNEAANPRPKR